MSEDEEAKPEPRCPVCGKPRSLEWRPFCSRLCRDRDLLNWLDAKYSVPAVESEEDDDEEPPANRE
ncbi:MAG: DNA gyrase inhibitor YacG [Geminicoccaceae bacterium]